MSMYVVLKSLPGPTGPLVPGLIIDSAGWRNVRALEDQRYIRAATAEELASAVDIEDVELPPVPAKKKSPVTRVRRRK